MSIPPPTGPYDGMAISMLVEQWRAELAEIKTNLGDVYYTDATSARRARAYAAGLGRAIDGLRELYGEEVCGESHGTGEGYRKRSR